MVDFTSHFYVQYSNEQEMYNAVLNFGQFPRAGSVPPHCLQEIGGICGHHSSFKEI